jgi:hypothetical protein
MAKRHAMDKNLPMPRRALITLSKCTSPELISAKIAMNTGTKEMQGATEM